MAVGDAGDQGAKSDVVGTASGEGEGAPAFEHFVFCWAYVGNLEEVVHDPEAVEACAFGALGDEAEGVAEFVLAVGPGEAGDL